MSAHRTDAIILIAHGSRNSNANEEVLALAEQLQDKTGQPVYPAFLDTVAQPNIPEVVDQVMQTNPSRILILPYFLNSGNHVSQDIPNIMAQKQAEYPDMSFILKPHVGSDPMIVEILASLLK